MEGDPITNSVSRLLPVLCLCLFSSTGFGDEALPAEHALQSLTAATAWSPRWGSYSVFDRRMLPDRWAQPFTHIEFRDNSVLGRVSRLRNLSLLTLAETSQTKLFLGVNDDGLAGLHFVAYRGYGNDRYLTVARMPYLKQKK